jgi:hypothetical protein
MRAVTAQTARWTLVPVSLTVIVWMGNHAGFNGYVERGMQRP